MTATAEIDKAGRLVVPKKVRDAMRVRAGDRFRVEQRGDEIVLRPELSEGSLARKGGMWVISGRQLDNYDIVKLIEDDREARARFVSGESDEP